MMQTTLGIALVCALAAGPAFAHHSAVSLGTVRITQPVTAGGTTLQPGTYEVRDTGEHTKPLPGQSEDAQATIEFVSNGTVVARDVAEVMTAAPVPVGTSGSSSRLVVQTLRGNEFVRISTNRNGERYLIHLPMAGSR